MTTHFIGAERRPTFSLHCEAKAQPHGLRRKRRSSTLSTLELRRLVAAMVD